MNPLRPILASFTLLACLILAASPARAQAPCAADITGNGVVDALDLGQVLNAWGACQGCSADIDGDGIVAGEDMAAVLNSWGFVCPQITGISPVAGPPSGGNTVTITGTHLGGVTEVRIGEQSARKVAVVDDHTVTAVVPASTPAGATGARLLTVKSDGGESSVVNGYTYVDLGAPARPSITGASPQYVSAAGGDTITVTGANFTGTTEVTVAGISCTFQVVSDSSVTVTSPAHAKGGMFNLSVTTPGGTATQVNWIAFYQTPSWATLVEAFPDASVVTDESIRVAILQSGYPWSVLSNYIGQPDNVNLPVMRLIPAGTFTMGCSDTVPLPNGAPAPHAVTLTKPFYIANQETTQQSWTTVFQATGKDWSHTYPGWSLSPSFFSYETGDTPADSVQNRPVEQVAWTWADLFCQTTGTRLPTEAEWEYAARGGTTTAYHGWPAMPDGTNDDSGCWCPDSCWPPPSNDCVLSDILWSSCNSGTNNCTIPPPVGTCQGQTVHDCGSEPTVWIYETHRGGLLQPNGYGLYDMLGNVYEWTNDYDGPPDTAPSTDPTGPTSGSSRVVRGSDFWYPRQVWYRTSLNESTQPMGWQDDWHPTAAGIWVGFRVANDPDEGMVASSVSPNGGSIDGNTEIQITGTNLQWVTDVSVGGVAATLVSVADTTVVAKTPYLATVGPKDVVVSSSWTGNSSTIVGGFYAVNPPPTGMKILEALPDPSVVFDPGLREQIIATGLPWAVEQPLGTSGIVMVLIPPGSFDMGCSASNQYSCYASESPVHAVTLTGAFYMSRYEVTQAQWQAKTASNPSYFQGQADSPSRPVESVSYDAIQQEFLFGASGLRLPTEAEWEYACRAGTTTAFSGWLAVPAGTADDTLVGNIAWSSGNSASQTHPAGALAPNGFGLYDMSGNVWEWCNDWFAQDYYQSSPSSDPPGPLSGTGRVVRGGAFDSDSDWLRSSSRESFTPDQAVDTLGFRVVRTVQLVPGIQSVSPSDGVTTGGNAITITGTNLSNVTSVTIGGAAATSVVAVNSTTVTAVTPAGAAGAATVALTTPQGVASLVDGFTYHAPPTITQVEGDTPDGFVPTSGGTITIRGTDLSGVTSVTVCGLPAIDVSVVNATAVTASIPPGAVGPCEVVVSTPWTSVTVEGGVTYYTALSWADAVQGYPDASSVPDAGVRAQITALVQATGHPWLVKGSIWNTANLGTADMVLIPPGTFDMGCSPSSQWGCASDENPVHSVTLTSAFYIGCYEVTQAQWTQIMGSNPSNFQSWSAQVTASQVPTRPVEQVSWNDVQGFLTTTGFRLPTEAEWEYAYRAGTPTAFHTMPGYPNGTNDDTQVGAIAWYMSNSVTQTRPVGGLAPNGFGLYDMSGNISEWCNDWFALKYYQSSPSTDPPGPASGSNRVLRGGYWFSSSEELRSSARDFVSPGYKSNSIGFRVARTP